MFPVAQMVHPITMPNSRDLLEKLLRGEPPSTDEIGNLLRTHTREDGRLEYKRGAWLDRDTPHADDPKDLGARLRKYATAFANAEGGLLLIGVSGGEEGQGGEKWSVVGCPTPPTAGWKILGRSGPRGRRQSDTLVCPRDHGREQDGVGRGDRSREQPDRSRRAIEAGAIPAGR